MNKSTPTKPYSVHIGVGRFRILRGVGGGGGGGAKFRNLGGRAKGGVGQIPSRHIMSQRRRCDVTTSHRRHFDVVCPLGF